MKWENINKDMVLSPTGMGIVFYSEGAVKDIPIGKDYLNKEYWDTQKVGDHIRKGGIVSKSRKVSGKVASLIFTGLMK